MSYRLYIAWFLPHVQSITFKHQFDPSQDNCHPYFLSLFCLFYPVQTISCVSPKTFCGSCSPGILKKILTSWKHFSVLKYAPWKYFSITYTLSSPGSFFQHLHSPAFSTRNVFGTYTASRIHRTSRNFIQPGKTLGIFLISKIPWNFFSASIPCISSFRANFSHT